MSSTLGELAAERLAVRRAVETLGLWPVMFELGARPHPPRDLYRAYLAQSHIFVGIYAESYGWVAPGENVSGLEDEYERAAGLPRLLYVKQPAPDRDERLVALLNSFKADDAASYKSYSTPDDLEELVHNDLAVLLAERFAATAAKATEASSSLPPVPLTQTVGRREEVAAIARLLADGERLVTLTGPGGVGKTRLALEVARLLRDEDGRAQCYVPLAPVRSPSLVVRTIADRLGARTEGRPVFEAVVEHLSGDPKLLVLDNLEQVPAAGNDLSGLLERCPELQILGTSRQALRQRAEREVSVLPLPLPDPATGFDAIRKQPAVMLFVDRARSVAPRFQLTRENAAAVARLCARLDGLPLAIELAAARTRALSVAALLERLEERFDILSGGPGDLPDRQRTLRSTIDWTYQLLDDDERSLFARLAVFTGGWSLDAAEAVCGEGLGSSVLDVLTALLDKSLVTIADDEIVGEARFGMLETIRSYALERLEEGEEEAEVRARHLDWYRALSDGAQPYLCGPGQREWAARFDLERANLRAAINTALARRDDNAVVELVWDVIVFYTIRDALDEPEAWFERVVDGGRPLDEVTAAKLGSLRELIHIARGDYSRARAPLESALQLFGEVSMDFEAAVCLHQLALVYYVVDKDVDAAVGALVESSRLFNAVNHDWGVSLVEAMLGSLLMAQGQLDAGEFHHRISLDRARRIDNEPLIAQALVQLGLIHVLRDNPHDALPLLGEAVQILRGGRFQTNATYCLDAIAGVAVSTDRSEAAVRALAVAESVRHRLGTSVWPMFRRITQGFHETARRQLGDATFEAAFARSSQGEIFDVLGETYEEVSLR